MPLLPALPIPCSPRQRQGAWLSSPQHTTTAALPPWPLRRCQLIRRAAGVLAVPAGPGQTSAIGRDTFPVPLLAQVKVGL